jgi:hypothetical protein
LATSAKSFLFGMNVAGLTIYELIISLAGVNSDTLPLHRLSTCIVVAASSNSVGNLFMYHIDVTTYFFGVSFVANLPDNLDIVTSFVSTSVGVSFIISHAFNNFHRNNLRVLLFIHHQNAFIRKA